MMGVCKSEHFELNDLYVYMFIVIVIVQKKNKYFSITLISFLFHLYLSTPITEIILFKMNFEQRI